MKSILRVSIISILTLGVMITLGSSVTNAQVFGGYQSGVQIANLESTPATITITGYKADGTPEEAETKEIPGNGSITLLGVSLPVSENFSGSIVISSDKQTAAISNIFESNRTAYASYVGSGTGSNTVSLPLLVLNRGTFTTWYSVQNAGSSEATVTAKYSDGVTREEKIPVGAAKVFYHADEGHADNSVFAATIESDQPIIAAVIQESAERKNMFSYTGFGSGATNPVFPLVQQNNPPNRTPNNRTGLQIQNIGTEATEVTVKYVPGIAGTECDETISIEPGASAQFGFRIFNGQSSPGTSTCVKERFVGAARVTTNSTNQPLVGIGNQVRSGVNGEAYGSFDPNAATNKVVMPLLMANNNNFFTGIAVQHVGGPASAVNCTYSDEGTDTDFTEELAVGAAFSVLQTKHFSARFVGSGACTAANAETKIVAVVNQIKGGSTVDQFLVYEGVSVSGN